MTTEGDKQPVEATSDLSDRLGACVWSDDEDGIWWSACRKETNNENGFCFDIGGPDENGFTFCPYCGRKLCAVYA
jgi:hypothetical protein